MTPSLDPSNLILLKNLGETAVEGVDHLWLADESQATSIDSLLPFQKVLTLLTNRFDIAERATAIGIKNHFSDWTISDKAQFSRVYLRICKEKPINLHLLRLAFNHLRPNGQLVLAGQKDEGIKTIVKYAAALFDQTETLTKHGITYLAVLTKGHHQNTDKSTLDLSEYHQMRSIGSWQGFVLQSKYGVYGWDKIDRGSELLIETALNYLNPRDLKAISILDLGCGYGFLSVASRSIPCQRRVATDNNAAALLSTKINADALNLNLEVVAGDCGDSVEGRFDLVLCNPPFHKGFNVESDLTQRFVNAAASKTHQHGMAFFVVNSFIAIEKKINNAFKKYAVLANNGQFKVVALQH